MLVQIVDEAAVCWKLGELLKSSVIHSSLTLHKLTCSVVNESINKTPIIITKQYIHIFSVHIGLFDT